MLFTNPFLDTLGVETKRKTDRRAEQTFGELDAQAVEVSAVHFVDKTTFVKVMSRAMREGFGLGLKAQRMWWIVLDVIGKEAIGQDEFYLTHQPSFQLGDDKAGQVEITKTTFYDGLAELRAAGFIAKQPHRSGWYWINPAMVWNGDRVRFINEYRIKHGGTGPKVLYPRARKIVREEAGRGVRQ